MKHLLPLLLCGALAAPVASRAAHRLPERDVQSALKSINRAGHALTGAPGQLRAAAAGQSDYPLAPEGLTATLSDDFLTVHLSWQPVGEVGETGGWVDTSDVTYYIFDAFGSYYDEPIAVTTDTWYDFDYSDYWSQGVVAYQVTAGVGEMYSLASTSNMVCFGTPDPLPYGTSFLDGYISWLLVADPDSSRDGYLCGAMTDSTLTLGSSNDTDINSQDGDNGFFYWMPTAADVDFGFFTVKFDISSAQQPVYQFWYRGDGCVINAKVSADGAPFEIAESVDLSQSPADGWRQCRVDLTPWSGARYVQVELMMHSAGDAHGQSVCIDNIQVRDLADSPLRPVSLRAPEIHSGENLVVTARLENPGIVEHPASEIKFSSFIWEVTEPTPAIKPGEFVEVACSVETTVFNYGEFSLWVHTRPGDNEGDTWAYCETWVDRPVYPFPEYITEAEVENDQVHLTWEEASIEKAYEFIDEQFESESYEPLTISDFGDWHMVDRDGLPTYTFLQDTKNPHRTKPMAFQVYDPVLAGVPDEYLIDVEPYSYDRMLVGWSCAGQNDNWLISPLLTGHEQTISFYAKSFTAAFPESFEVLWSDGGLDPDDFTAVEVDGYPANGRVSEEWTRYRAALPEGAKRFAIRMTSYDSYALYIDDIWFEAPSLLPDDIVLVGYNVYRDEQLVAQTAQDVTSAVDTPPSSGRYAYNVSAVYNYGESRPSWTRNVDLTVTGVGSVAGGVSVSAEGDCIVVAGAEGKTLKVARLDGVLLWSGRAAAAQRIEAAPGVYLVEVDGRVTKLAL